MELGIYGTMSPDFLTVGAICSCTVIYGDSRVDRLFTSFQLGVCNMRFVAEIPGTRTTAK